MAERVEYIRIGVPMGEVGRGVGGWVILLAEVGPEETG